jgi:hypothetical protein
MVNRTRDIRSEVREALAQLRAQLAHFERTQGSTSRLARETRSKINRIERRAAKHGQ